MTDSAADVEKAAFDDGVWTQHPPERRRWGARHIAAAVAIAVVIGGLGGAAIHAARGNAPHFGPFMSDMSRDAAPEGRHVGGPAIS
ncbi:MAG: hypothetical protein PGN37_00510 [Mycobacterium kyogaense]|uniref:hypothetical protein n=1 Tax=Mycobacterium kyogaense TaxID=2212479 RepID=UPI002FF8C23B